MTDAFHNPYWHAPDWLADGDDVWLPRGEDEATGKTRATRCKVAVAAGNHARIVNEARGIDLWVPLNMLLVGPEDEHHPNGRRATEDAIIEALKAPTETLKAPTEVLKAPTDLTKRSRRFLRGPLVVPSATPAEPIVVDGTEAGQCQVHIDPEDGWWRADVTFEGQRRHIGRFGSEAQAKRVADRWVEALVGPKVPFRRKRGQAGKPGRGWV